MATIFSNTDRTFRIFIITLIAVFSIVVFFGARWIIRINPAPAPPAPPAPAVPAVAAIPAAPTNTQRSLDIEMVEIRAEFTAFRKSTEIGSNAETERFII